MISILLKRTFLVSAVCLIVAGCAGPVNDETTSAMPTGYICRLLDSNEYITAPSEQKSFYRELDKRGEKCPDVGSRNGYVLIL